MRFDGQVVVVTGASTGIGQGLALRFAEEGAAIVVNSRSSVAAGQAVAAEITGRGGRAAYVQADVTQAGDVRRLFVEVINKFGRVDVLINNAGVIAGWPFADSTAKNWLAVIEANLLGAVLCSAEAAPHMRRQGAGRIISTSSVRGLERTGREGIIAYSAAKAALNNFTTTLAKELAPQILVNAVAPGFVYTGRYYDQMPPDQVRAFLGETAIKRFITVDELVEAYVFLASSSVITGQILVVDGGLTLKLTAAQE